MSAYFYDLYVRQIGFFIPDLPIEQNTPDDLVVNDNVNAVFRDVRLFVQQIRRVDDEQRQQFKVFLFSSLWLISHCLKGEIKQ